MTRIRYDNPLDIKCRRALIVLRRNATIETPEQQMWFAAIENGVKDKKRRDLCWLRESPTGPLALAVLDLTLGGVGRIYQEAGLGYLWDK